MGYKIYSKDEISHGRYEQWNRVNYATKKQAMEKLRNDELAKRSQKTYSTQFVIRKSPEARRRTQATNPFGQWRF